MEESVLEKEPIDVVFKYIDLSDPNLIREGIPQIKKDEDNEELRYTLCSVLQNLPWVHHIFIIMPNERVRFLKPQEEIAEKSNVHQRQRFPRVRQRVFYRFFSLIYDGCTSLVFQKTVYT